MLGCLTQLSSLLYTMGPIPTKGPEVTGSRVQRRLPARGFGEKKVSDKVAHKVPEGSGEGVIH